MYAIFIDLKSAYNTVNREKLYQILLEEKIFSLQEVDFIRLLHA